MRALRVLIPNTGTGMRTSDIRISEVTSGIVVVSLCVTQLGVSTWMTVKSDEGTRALALALVLVPVQAVVLGMRRSRNRGWGPDIHDRQLDGIICAGATLFAILLMALALVRPDLGRLDLLAVAVTAVAALVHWCGTRRLWQMRAAVVALIPLWPTPWITLKAELGAHLAEPVAQCAVVGALLVAPAAFGAGGSRVRRILAIPTGAAGGAGTALVAWSMSPVAVPGAIAVLILTALAAVLLCTTPRTTSPA